MVFPRNCCNMVLDLQSPSRFWYERFRTGKARVLFCNGVGPMVHHRLANDDICSLAVNVFEKIIRLFIAVDLNHSALKCGELRKLAFPRSG